MTNQNKLSADIKNNDITTKLKNTQTNTSKTRNRSPQKHITTIDKYSKMGYFLDR